MSSATKTTLQALYRANLGIIRQKLDLLEAIKQQFGVSHAKQLFAQKCPIVQASVGQHLRHSLDHMELVAKAAAVAALSTTTSTKSVPSELHYDLRQRGGNDETDLFEAEARIKRVQQLLVDQIQHQAHKEDDSEKKPGPTGVENNIDVYFMLSGDPEEFKLPTTLSRELGFAAHHGIHHLAMVKVIALETLQLNPDLLPPDFGKAPSTIVHENNTAQSQT